MAQPRNVLGQFTTATAITRDLSDRDIGNMRLVGKDWNSPIINSIFRNRERNLRAEQAAEAEVSEAFTTMSNDDEMVVPGGVVKGSEANERHTRALANLRQAKAKRQKRASLV